MNIHTNEIFIDDQGPFDILGDIHGCADELLEMLEVLGYMRKHDHIAGNCPRRIIFLGDLVNRGPDSAAVLDLVMDLVDMGRAYCLPGNHDIDLLHILRGDKDFSPPKKDIENTINQIEINGAPQKRRLISFLESLASHHILDRGRLVVAHAGMPEHLQGSNCEASYRFALSGKQNPEENISKIAWVKHYRGEPLVVHGHKPVKVPRWRNRTLDIDTGCVYGGALTSLRYPEMKLVRVDAARAYYLP